MREVLVGVDGSPRSEVAWRWAEEVAGQTGAVLTQVTVSDGPEEVGDRSHGEVPSSVGGTPPVVTQTIELHGKPGPELLAEATRRRPGLVVVGAGVHRAVGSTGHHHVAEHLARHLAQPLAIVPTVDPVQPVRDILAGVSGGPRDTAVLTELAELASAIGAKVVAVHVFHRPAEFWVHADPRSQWSKTHQIFEDLWIEPLRSAGVLDESLMVDSDDPAGTLCELADSFDSDLIAVGGGHQSTLGLARLGSVPGRLLHRCLSRPMLQLSSSNAGERASEDLARWPEGRTSTAPR